MKITEEIDDFMSSKNKNEFGLNLNKSFYESLKGFKPLKSMRTRRSRISKIKKSKVIEKKLNSEFNVNLNQNISNDSLVNRNFHDWWKETSYLLKITNNLRDNRWLDSLT